MSQRRTAIWKNFILNLDMMGMSKKKALEDINLYVAYVFVYKSHPEVCV